MENCRRAISRLADAGTVLASSSLYLTEPVGVRGQEWYVNGVVALKTELQPLELLRHLHKIEAEMGRQRPYPWAPRTIDLDILYFDDLVLSHPDLTIPHPRVAQRRFVLSPLLEIAPDFTDPLRKLTVRELLERCPDKGVVEKI